MIVKDVGRTGAGALPDWTTALKRALDFLVAQQTLVTSWIRRQASSFTEAKSPKGVSRKTYEMQNSTTKYTRIQLEMPAERVAEAEALMAKTGLRTRKELFDNALTL